jgi:antitoxin YefM
MMDVINVNDAQRQLNAVINESAKSHTPVIITGHQNQAVLVALEDWNVIQETLYILQLPGMREDILEGMRTPVKECVTKEELDW